MEKLNNSIDKNLSTDGKLEELWNKLSQQYGDYNGDWYAYQIEYSEKKENWDDNLESQKLYKAEMMWEVFSVWLDSPEQMINILKLTDGKNLSSLETDGSFFLSRKSKRTRGFNLHSLSHGKRLFKLIVVVLLLVLSEYLKPKMVISLSCHILLTISWLV